MFGRTLIAAAASVITLAPGMMNRHRDYDRVANEYGITKGSRRLRSLVNPKINRWTGKPHEHKREIARNQRQAHIAAGTHAWRGRNPIKAPVA